MINLSDLKKTLVFINKNLSDEDIELYFLDNPKESEELFNNLQWFLQRTCGNTNRINEKISFIKESNLRKGVTIIHNKESYGPDIVYFDNENNNNECFIEEKTSSVKKKTNFKANFVFKFSDEVKNDIKNENIAFIIEKFYTSKVKNGYVILNVKYESDLLFTKKISGEFISLLLTKLSLKHQSVCINIGCQICDKCLSYHRILHYKKFDKILKNRIGKEKFQYKLDYFDEKEWIDILAKIPSKCKK